MRGRKLAWEGIRLPLAYTLQSRQNCRTLLQPKRPEQPHGRHTKHTQQLLRHGLQPHINRVRRRQAREAECHVAAGARQHDAVAKVQPVGVVGVVGRVRRDLQLAAAVFRQDVLDDGVAFGKRDGTVLDYGRATLWVVGAEAG